MKTIEEYQREAQNKATTFGKKTYLYRKNGLYRIAYKKPVGFDLRANYRDGFATEFTPMKYA